MKKLAVSNIAWSSGQRDAAYALLRDNGIGGLEIAPGLLFEHSDDPFRPARQHVGAVMRDLHAYGLEIVSMQSLLFGVEGAELFGNEVAQDRFMTGMCRAIDLAGDLGIPNLVFGSPKQRIIPQDIPDSEAFRIATDIFRALGENALKAGTRITIEFNPPEYGTNFLNDITAASHFVETVDSTAIGLILDIGAIHMNGEFDRLEEVVSRSGKLIRHVHMSEPFLAPAPAKTDDALKVFQALTSIGYDDWISIEMKRPDEGSLTVLQEAVTRFVTAAGAVQ